jgi:hypothetical protein
MPARARAREVALGAAAVALLAAVACGVLAAVPATQTDTRTLTVTQKGQFSYTGAAAPGTTYPTGSITTGDTVWTRLARGVTVSYTNTVTGAELADLRGVMRLDVSVVAADGWSAVLASGPVSTLEEGTATASVALAPDRAADLLTRHYDEIGTSGGSATLTVTPVAATTGTTEGHAFSAGSPEAMTFTLDATSLRPSGKVATDFSTSTPTPLQVEEVAPRSFPVLAFTVPIDVARITAAAILALALGALAVAAWVGRSLGRGVADQFLVRHADRIVPVAAFTSGPAVIDVSDAESLHRVAERFDTIVLHHASPDEDVFVVRDLDATYRYVVPGASNRRRGKPPVPASPHASAPAPAHASAPTLTLVPPDLTGPLPLVVPVPASASGGLWGARLA